jgi:hypothetical protein
MDANRRGECEQQRTRKLQPQIDETYADEIKPRIDANDNAGFRRPRETRCLVRSELGNPEDRWRASDYIFASIRGFLFVSIRSSHRPAGQGPRDIRQRAI